MEAERPWTATADGVRLAVRLVPGAAHDALDGVVTGADGRPALRIRLRARPIEGAANAALIAHLAAALGLRRSAIAIRSGETARTKVLNLRGEGAALEAWVAEKTNGGRASS